jgi:uncharacterized membrane protein
MVDVTTAILISKPCEQVAAYVMDPDRAPEWYVNIKSVEWKTPKPLTLNSKVAFEAHFLGKKLSYTYEVTKLSATGLVMRTSEGPFPMETTYYLEVINSETTRMTLNNTGNPTGFSKLVAPFMTMMMRKANRNDLKRLKKILEGDHDVKPYLQR